ncbi:Gfo/Idh/MocA family protein [Amphibacillus jilinensis]|uniref:Gfo/Idh/MocA family protein n=1 Tax=Amphibacillus jilinensis TaxID=1216008 RepID=UPI00031EF5AD|nr:Gfo/Idh/MocA family oxidoreductase [Amphibacillus jilinensis]
MKKLRIGIIGCGFIAEKHVKTLNRLSEQFTCYGLVDQKLERAKAVNKLIYQPAEELTLYTDYQALIERTDIDVVIITAPSFLHGKMVIDSLLHDKHVIVEKPLSLSLEEADHIIACSKKTGKHVLVCHQMRYRPLFQKIKSLFDKHQFGQPYLATSSILLNRSEQYYKETDWRGTWQYDGGMLLNQGLHVADLLIWYLGDIDWIFGKTTNFSTWKETEDLALSMFKFKNGAYGSVTATSQVQPHNLGYQLQFICEDGTLAINGPALNHIEHFHIKHQRMSADKLINISTDTDDRYYMYQDFYQALTDEQHQPLMTASEAKNVLNFIYSLYQADKINQMVYPPLTTFSTMNMKEKDDEHNDK